MRVSGTAWCTGYKYVHPAELLPVFFMPAGEFVHMKLGYCPMKGRAISKLGSFPSSWSYRPSICDCPANLFIVHDDCTLRLDQELLGLITKIDQRQRQRNADHIAKRAREAPARGIHCHMT